MSADMTQPNRVDRVAVARCPICKGWDMGGIGVVHHRGDCRRAPCQFCGLEVWSGERWTLHAGLSAHYDCAADFELDRIEDQEARRG